MTRKACAQAPILSVFTLMPRRARVLQRDPSASHHAGFPKTKSRTQAHKLSGWKRVYAVFVLCAATATVARAQTSTAPASFDPTTAGMAPHGSLVRSVKATERSKGKSAQAPQAQADWPEFRHDQAHSGYDPYETVLSPTTVGGLGVLWEYNTGTTVWSSPAVANGGLYYGADDGNIYALDTSTGALMWKYATAAQVWSSPAVVDGVVYVGAGTEYGPGDYNVYALDAATGSLVWNYTTGGNVQSSPVVDNGVVYVTSRIYSSGDNGDNVYAINASTGTLLWTYPGVAGTWSSPAVDNGVVYVGSTDGVYALNAGNGTLLWSFPIGPGTNSSPAIANGAVYVGAGAGDNNLYALDAGTGALDWKYTTGYGVDSSPAVANGVVYVGSYDGNVYALDASAGTLLWSYQGGNISSPAVSSGVVYVASSSGTVYAFELPGAPTSTSLASSLNPSNYGQSVTFSATVTSNSGTPTGTVNFYNGSTEIGSATLSNGSASISTSSLPAGSDSITAAYQGSSGYAPSTSAVLAQVVNGTVTTTSVGSSLNPSGYGQTVTFTAAVTSNSGTPSGTVIFYDGSTVIGTATLSNGTASVSTSLPAGSQSITAAYQGAGGFDPSTSAVLTQIVNLANTTITLASSVNPVPLRQSVTYAATITTQYGGTAAGTVMFQDNGVTVATVGVSNNQATFTTKYTVAGVQPMTATYSGDSNNLGSTSSVLLEDAGKVPYESKTDVETSGSPSSYGQAVAFAATVTSKDGAIPSGETVTFYSGSEEIGTGTTANGVATFTTSSLSAKTHTIKATYAGDATFEKSSGKVSQVVELYSTATVLSSSLNPSDYGQAVTFTATVTSAGPTPTGKVRFKDGTTGIGAATLSGGVATLTKSKLAVGTHSITALYDGDSESGKSTSPVLSQVVN